MKWHFDLPLWRWRPAAHLHPAALWHLRTRGEKTPTQSDGKGLKRACLIVMMNYFCAATGKKMFISRCLKPRWQNYSCLKSLHYWWSSSGIQLRMPFLPVSPLRGGCRHSLVKGCKDYIMFWVYYRPRGQKRWLLMFCRLLVSVTTSLELMWNKMYN